MPPRALKSTGSAFTFVSVSYLWNHELICHTLCQPLYVILTCHLYVYTDIIRRSYFVRYPLFGLSCGRENIQTHQYNT